MGGEGSVSGSIVVRHCGKISNPLRRVMQKISAEKDRRAQDLPSRMTPCPSSLYRRVPGPARPTVHPLTIGRRAIEERLQAHVLRVQDGRACADRPTATGEHWVRDHTIAFTLIRNMIRHHLHLVTASQPALGAYVPPPGVP
jgi:hypothetical protein